MYTKTALYYQVKLISAYLFYSLQVVCFSVSSFEDPLLPHSVREFPTSDQMLNCRILWALFITCPYLWSFRRLLLKIVSQHSRYLRVDMIADKNTKFFLRNTYSNSKFAVQSTSSEPNLITIHKKLRLPSYSGRYTCKNS